MKRYIHIFIFITLYVLMPCVEAGAVKATANIIKYRQPDGSVIFIKMSGDEFFGYAVTTDGHIVSKAPDGYFYHANYNAGFLSITNERANVSESAGKKNLTYYTRSCSVPYGISMDLRKKAVQLIDPGLANGVEKQNNISKIYYFSNSIEHEGLLQGEKRFLVLLVKFADKGFANGDDETKRRIENMLNQKGYSYNGATGCVADYFNANFGEGHNFVFDLYGAFELPQSVEYYGGRTSTMNDADAASMIADACKAAFENGVDFSLYDCNKDGFADNVAVIFAGCNEAESGNSSLVWPHKGNISERDISYNGVKIASYTCSSELSGSEDNPSVATIGVFCHEFAHALGLPDMYDSNGSEEGLANALYGKLSIMDEGNYLNGGNTPPFFNVVEREILGLCRIADLKQENFYELLPVQDCDTIYRIPSVNEGEYFLVECRNPSGWDAWIGGGGMVVYHVDKSDNIVGGISAKRRWELNILNTYAAHECVKVLAANPYKVSDKNIGPLFFPSGGVSSLTASGVPKLEDWAGNGVGFSLKNISYSNGSVRFYAEQGVALDDGMPYAFDIKSVVYQNDALLRWSVSSNDLPESDEGVWQIILQESADDLHGNDTTGNNREDVVPAQMPFLCTQPEFLFKNLKAGTSYSGKIYFVKENSMGKAAAFSFVTDSVTSPYPCIKVQGRYKKGDIAVFGVQNLTEKYDAVKIRLNGVLLSENHYKFEDLKEYEVEVSIHYPDKSVDVITKKIVVE